MFITRFQRPSDITCYCYCSWLSFKCDDKTRAGDTTYLNHKHGEIMWVLTWRLHHFLPTLTIMGNVVYNSWGEGKSSPVSPKSGPCGLQQLAWQEMATDAIVAQILLVTNYFLIKFKGHLTDVLIPATVNKAKNLFLEILGENLLLLFY